ncbi:MAG: hypothetical protein ABIK28_23015 [Planctomycetota bacterium]
MFPYCIEKLRNWLQSRHLAWQLALLAMVLCVSSLQMGLQLDDYFHRGALARPEIPHIARSPAELFVFLEGGRLANRMAITLGFLPWWTHEELRIAFFRPVTSLFHWLDYRLWPDLQWLMHLHSLVWLGLVVIAATIFYRRMLHPSWIAGLAALLFAVDDAHGMPAAWLANRNTLISGFFGLLSLIAYDRWRRSGRRVGAFIAPITLLLGLLSKESTLTIAAYLLAYALFLDQAAWIRRIGALIPCILVGALWLAAYKKMGYGTIGSGWYLDPGTNPAGYAQAVMERAPILLAWQWWVPSGLDWALSPQAAHRLWLGVMGFMAILAVALAPLLRRDPLARFFALGMVLSVLPACAAYPSPRLLFFAGIGGMGLLAQLFAAALRKAHTHTTRMTSKWRGLVCALCLFFAFIHLGMAPLDLARSAGTFNRLAKAMDRAGDSLPSGPEARFQTVLIVNTPTFMVTGYSALKRMIQGDPVMSRTLVLGSGGRSMDLYRPDENTLLIRPKGGYLPAPESLPQEREMERLLFDQRYGVASLDRLYRDSTPMAAGDRIELIGMTIEITEVTDDGRPMETAFHFKSKLDNPYLCWLQWRDGAFVPFALPAVGGRVMLPAAAVP